VFSLIKQKRPTKNGKEFCTVAKIVHRPDDVFKIIGFPVRDVRDLRDNNEVTKEIPERMSFY
jgi:hypothetical protein